MVVKEPEVIVSGEETPFDIAARSAIDWAKVDEWDAEERAKLDTFAATLFAWWCYEMHAPADMETLDMFMDGLKMVITLDQEDETPDTIISIGLVNNDLMVNEEWDRMEA